VVPWCRNNKIPIIWVKADYPVLTKEQKEDIRKYLPSHLGTHDNSKKPTCCLKDTYGQEFYPLVFELMDKNDIILTKRWYSAFMRNNLEDKLKEMGINNILVSGVATHVCVYSTILHSRELGFKNTLIKDCCNSKREKHHNLGIYKARSDGALIITTDELLKDQE